MKHTIGFIVAICLALSSAAQSQGVSINATGDAPDPSAGLEVDFENKGFLPPRLTSSQRDQISNPALGLTIFNTTTSCLEFFVGGVWQTIACGCSGAPDSPAGDSQTVMDGGIIWNWNAVVGAEGYKWNTVDNYATSTDLGMAISFTQIGAPVCEELNTIYVWAYNDCGNSAAAAFNVMGPACPFVCGTESITVNHVAGDVSPQTKTVTYGTIVYNGKCWIDRNLGADVQASSESDATDAAAGWYWQFNRKQGVAPGPLPSWNNSPITDMGLWEASKEPCKLLLGEDWRIPTESEWNSADAFGGWNNFYQTYASPLKIHGAGYLATGAGDVQERGSYGLYWANEVYGGTSGRTMRMNAGSSAMDNGYQATGFSVRCISDL